MDGSYRIAEKCIADFSNRLLLRDDEPVHLSPRQWSVLEVLAAQSLMNRYARYSQIADVLWPDYAIPWDKSQMQMIKDAITPLRKAIGRDAIINSRGYGYRLAKDVEPCDSETVRMDSLPDSEDGGGRTEGQSDDMQSITFDGINRKLEYISSRIAAIEAKMDAYAEGQRGGSTAYVTGLAIQQVSTTDIMDVLKRVSEDKEACAALLKELTNELVRRGLLTLPISSVVGAVYTFPSLGILRMGIELISNKRVAKKYQTEVDKIIKALDADIVSLAKIELACEAAEEYAILQVETS